MRPLLSIIVPAYNAAAYLEDCVNSIIASTFQNFEILLINDGSTDKTGAICDELASNEKIKVYHTENRGICAARNLGLEKARGELIGFVDADDIVAPDMLETLICKMTNDVQMVVCRFIRCKRNEKSNLSLSSQRFYKANTEETANSIILGGYGCYVWNKIYRKAILDDNGIRFRADIMVAEDQFFVMDYLNYCECAVFCERELYHYVMDNGSIMNTFRQSAYVPKKYTGLPRAWAYSAKVLQPLSRRLEVYAQSRGVMFYQTVLRKLEKPDEKYISEAINYVKKHKSTLLRYTWGLKYYISALVLCISYPLWAKVFRRHND